MIEAGCEWVSPVGLLQSVVKIQVLFAQATGCHVCETSPLPLQLIMNFEGPLIQAWTTDLDLCLRPCSKALWGSFLDWGEETEQMNQQSLCQNILPSRGHIDTVDPWHVVCEMTAALWMYIPLFFHVKNILNHNYEQIICYTCYGADIFQPLLLIYYNYVGKKL